MHILAIIPARGGSRGIPLKNTQNLAGIPLIVYTIKEAKKSKYLDKILVSTDSKKIARMSKSLGAEVPFLRPKKISTDNSRSLDYVKHALKYLDINESYRPDIVLILQPTSPLRTAKMIDKSIELLKKSNASCILGVSKIKTHPFLTFSYDNNYLKPFKQDFQKYYQRQKFPTFYYPTGSIYTLWRKTIEKYNSLYGPQVKPMIINDETKVDVDDWLDLFFCEMIIRNWNKYKKNKRL